MYKKLMARKLWWCFFYCTELLIFMRIIFSSSVVLVWTFNTTGVYNFITRNSSKFVSVFQWFLVPILSLLKVWSNEWAKKSFLLKSKRVGVIHSKQNKAVGKALVLSPYVWRTDTATFKKRTVIYELGSYFNQNHFI